MSDKIKTIARKVWNTPTHSDNQGYPPESSLAAPTDSLGRHSVQRLVLRRVWAMPCLDTFDIPVIGDFVKWRLKHSKCSIDPYSRNKRWATYTNDLNPNTAAEYHMDAEDFLKLLIRDGVTADLVIIDPPYSPRQIKECYDSIGLSMKQEDAMGGATRKRRKSLIEQIVAPGGEVLHFGWSTVGLGEGWTQEEILLVCHGSDHNDTICLAERRNEPHPSLFAPENERGQPCGSAKPLK